MPEEYRWNVSDFAVGYDAAAELVHPFYREIQESILARLPFSASSAVLLVDAGGGSGRLVEKFLSRFPAARAMVVDQSEAFLALAQQRLRPFGRADCHLARLQDDWISQLTEPPAAIVSMSAVHHLDPREKREFYRRCYDALRPGGILLNGDEVRPEDEQEYLWQCQAWAAHMNRLIEAGSVPEPLHAALRQWHARNVEQFGQPRRSGDDCHETADAQVGYLQAAGFAKVDVPWRKDLWAVLLAERC